MQKRNFLKRLLGFFSTEHGSNEKRRLPGDAEQAVVIKRLGPGEVIVIKDCEVSEIYSLQAFRRLT